MFRYFAFIVLAFCFVSPVNGQANQHSRFKVRIDSLDWSFAERVGIDAECRGWIKCFTLSEIEDFFLLSETPQAVKRSKLASLWADDLWYSLSMSVGFVEQYLLLAECEETIQGDCRVTISGSALQGRLPVTESVLLKPSCTFCMLLNDLHNADRAWLLRFSR